MRLTEKEIQERRECMILIAFRLFCDRGIENVSMLEIAQKAQVAENTLYRYFGNKEQLVLEAFVKLWDTIMQNVERMVGSIPNYASLTGYGQMQVWIEGFRHLYKIDREFVLFSYEAKLYLLRHNMKLDKFQQDALMQSFRGPCLAALEKGKADGSIPVKESSEDLFYAIWGSIRGYVVKIVIYGKLYEEDNPWESRYKVVERGILSALSSGWNPPEN
ncbi:MAG: TetR/AcrR family transcriptional regulator [Clostridia bacterium]|nr:TetR/AcrR family transcriptional regulator [Clostridia bacterium]